MRAGEKVCIQVISPMQRGVEFASRQSAWIASGVGTTPLQTSFAGMAAAASSAPAISRACAATCSSTSGP